MFTDSLVIATYFLAIFGIGIYAGRKQKTLTDYALGNRSLPWWAILASILAAEISAATFLGAPGEGYHTRNFTYAQLCIGTILGRIIVGKLFLKPYYDYKVVSIYEYLEKRFGLLTRRTASMVFLISRVLASGTRLYFAGILLVIAYQFATNTPADSEQIVLLYIVALVIISIATTIYTAIGGLKAVVWTDVLQAAVLGVSMLSALWILFAHIPGGWDSISAAMNGGDDWKFFSWGTEKGLGFLEQCSHILGQEYTIWAAFLGATFITMATHGTDQDMVQRMLAAKNSKAGTRAVIVSGLMDFPIVLLFLFTGILLYVFYQYNPAALPADTPKLHVFPYFIIHELPGGVRGLLIAGLLATAMGSLSTALNSLATTATKDWYQGIFKPDATERQLLRCVRWGTVGFSLLLIMVGSVTAWYVVHHPEVRIIQIALGIFGYTYGSLLGIFLLGMLTRTRGNDTGNILAMAAGFIVIAVLTGLIPLPASWEQHIPEIAFPWRVTIGTLATFFVGLCFRSRHELPR
ncbi:MAG: sodium:proline symporter [Akkermansia sp.]|nr:sodium:proline symporter [Akkermansia sp.]